MGRPEPPGTTQNQIQIAISLRKRGPTGTKKLFAENAARRIGRRTPVCIYLSYLLTPQEP